MLEITERALAVRPADLLATVRRLRAAGWRIALDDVGADDLSLAFMPLLAPDVIKLDLALVQGRPGRKVAEIMNSVNAHAERSGCIILAEGIETAEHLDVARALGAALGQGWLFGRPARKPVSGLATGELRLPALPPVSVARSPFQCLPDSVALRYSTKKLLIEVSKHLEREAGRLGKSGLVVSTFQHARYFTPSTARRYTDLAERLGFVAAIGSGLLPEPAPGVRGADLEAGDPVLQEWDIVVLAPHFAAALIARDLGQGGAEEERFFEFALTYNRATAEAAARSLMSRTTPSTDLVIPPPSPSLGIRSTDPTVDRAPRAAHAGATRNGGQQPGLDVLEAAPVSATRVAARGDAERRPGATVIDRHRLVEVVDALLLDARMNDTGVAIICFHVKNPENSHLTEEHAGNAVRTATATLLQRLTRRRDVIAVHEHDVIIGLPGLDPGDAKAQATEIAGVLATAVSTLTAATGTRAALSVTMGISTFPADADDVEALVMAAETHAQPGSFPVPTPLS